MTHRYNRHVSIIGKFLYASYINSFLSDPSDYYILTILIQETCFTLYFSLLSCFHMQHHHHYSLICFASSSTTTTTTSTTTTTTITTTPSHIFLLYTNLFLLPQITLYKHHYHYPHYYYTSSFLFYFFFTTITIVTTTTTLFLAPYQPFLSSLLLQRQLALQQHIFLVNIIIPIDINLSFSLY